MVLVVIRTITEACRTTIAYALIIWKPAFASDTGVTEMVTWSVLTTCDAFDLLNRNGGIVSTTPWMSIAPMLPFHHADYAPC